MNLDAVVAIDVHVHAEQWMAGFDQAGFKTKLREHILRGKAAAPLFGAGL